jgi:hypothetical protein
MRKAFQQMALEKLGIYRQKMNLNLNHTCDTDISSRIHHRSKCKMQNYKTSGRKRWLSGVGQSSHS